MQAVWLPTHAPWPGSTHVKIPSQPGRSDTRKVFVSSELGPRHAKLVREGANQVLLVSLYGVVRTTKQYHVASLQPVSAGPGWQMRMRLSWAANQSDPWGTY
jgi:hypothetical protein